MDHRPIAQHGQVEAVAVEGDELRAQLRDLIAEGGDELLLGPLAHVGRADGVHRPVIGLPVRDEGSDADDRVVDVLGKLVADRLADFHVGLADKIVGGCEPGEVGHSLQVPDDDAWFHASWNMPRRMPSRKLLSCIRGAARAAGPRRRGDRIIKRRQFIAALGSATAWADCGARANPSQ